MNSLVIVPRNWGYAKKFPEYLNPISRIGTLFLDPLGVTNKVKPTLAAVSDAVLYSKLQVTQLLDIIQSIRDKDVRDQLVEDIYLYASSQSRFSSAYYKLEWKTLISNT